MRTYLWDDMLDWFMRQMDNGQREEMLCFIVAWISLNFLKSNNLLLKKLLPILSVWYLLLLDTRFSYFLIFLYFYAYQRPQFTRVFTFFFYRAWGSRLSHKFCRLRSYDVLVRIKFSNESVTCNSVCESTVAVKIRLKRSSFAFH